MLYIIISPSNSTKGSVAFWRANDAGYTYSPFAAGHYTEEQIANQPDYYNNGHNAVAIPLTDRAMGDLEFTCSVNYESLDKFMQTEKEKYRKS